MRAVIVAAALLIGTAAYAQDNSGGMQGSSASTAGPTVAPADRPVRRDARGIPVVSESASAPSGWNLPPGSPGAAPPSQPAAQQGSTGPLPPCTRHVTDRCTQTYERSHGDAAPATAAAGTSDDTGAAADTDSGTTKATHHRRRGHRK